MRVGPILAVTAALFCVASAASAEEVRPKVPTFFDPNRRVAKPDAGQVKSIRFLTTDDFPPFHFALPDGSLAGFDIDLARAICADLAVTCTIQARRFETLVAQIKQGTDDALIAAVANTPATRADLAFTAPYYTTPARFVAMASSRLDRMTPEALAGKALGVEAGTAHEAFLRTFYPKAKILTYPNQAGLRAALRKGNVELVFGDGLSLALWLNGTDANGCCAFRDGPFTESHYFGNGVSIAVGKGNEALCQALDYELAHLTQNGTYADLYLKYFPIGLY
jgi:polar amino acid transport system substrate-binding protein